MKPRDVRCLKFFVTLLNLLVIVFGLTLTGFCIAGMGQKKARPEEPLYLSKGVLGFFLTLCLCLKVTAVLGCIGALREHVKGLYLYSCFFSLLISVELVLGIGGAVISFYVGGSGSELRTSFYRNSTDELEVSKHHTYWDKIQSENKCCGVDGPFDYDILDRDIPPSCCVRAHPLREGGARRQLHSTCLTGRTYYNRGCEEVLRKKWVFKGKVFIFTAIIFIIVEILCVVLAVWLATRIRRVRRMLQDNLQAHFES